MEPHPQCEDAPPTSVLTPPSHRAADVTGQEVEGSTFGGSRYVQSAVCAIIDLLNGHLVKRSHCVPAIQSQQRATATTCRASTKTSW